MSGFIQLRKKANHERITVNIAKIVSVTDGQYPWITLDERDGEANAGLQVVDQYDEVLAKIREAGGMI